ncbi:MAG: Uma2 family endonuclease [Anaerolineales bacterium]
MAILTIPPTRAEDIEPAKEFLFAVYGEGRWTEEKYLELSGHTNRPIELSEGRLIVRPMPTPDHQRIVRKLLLILNAWALTHAAEVFFAPMPVRLWRGKFREPDVFLYTAEHRDRIAKQYGGPPDLAVEVWSPSTGDVDADEKMIEYAQAGISEYWIVEIETPRLAQYVLRAGTYELQAEFGAGATVRSAIFPDLEFGLDSLYASS